MSLTRPTMARFAWAVISVLSFILYLTRIPHRPAAVTPPSPYFYLWEIPLILIWMLVGAVILWRANEERLGWPFFIATMLSAYGATYMQDSRTEVLLPTAVALLAGLIHQAGGLGMFAFCFFFPDGRPVPRKLAYLLIPFWGLVAAPTFYAPFSKLSLYSWPAAISTLLVNALLVVNIGTQLYRYRTTRDPLIRQQTKWVVFGILVGAVGNMMMLSAHLALMHRPALVALIDVISNIAHAAIPVSIGFAILRYRLWDIDRIINRTLVYTALTGTIALIYTLAASWAGVLFQAQSNLGPLVGTGLVAFSFMPLRDRLQVGINRLMYGDRDNPGMVLSRLGTQLEANLAPDEVPPTVVQTVVESLRVPYAALILREDESYRMAAHAGAAVPESARIPFPLTDQGEMVGLLVVGRRSGEAEFTAQDLHLLRGLARQAGHAVHTIRLTQALQRSRELLVTAREEERRRMRNDLHDGLGPALSSYALTAGAVRREIDRDPDAAKELLVQLERDLQASLQEVRRLIYNLRPPLLDDLGLVGALRRAAGEFRHAGIDVSIEAPEPMPVLPAAVEVATFRIVQEALHNASKHAHAVHVDVALAVVDSLPGTGRGRRFTITIVDDGIGLDPQRTSGIGLSSMRERAGELGGACRVEPDLSGGVRVSAWLPLSGPDLAG